VVSSSGLWGGENSILNGCTTPVDAFDLMVCIYTMITICGLDHGGCLAINLSKKNKFSLVKINCAKNKTWQMAKGKNPPKPAAQFELKVS